MPRCCTTLFEEVKTFYSFKTIFSVHKTCIIHNLKSSDVLFAAQVAQIPTGLVVITPSSPDS